MAKNVYKVSKKTWKKWSPLAQGVFNRLYGMLIKEYNQVIYKEQDEHKVINMKEWRTLAHNAAWMAAYDVSNISKGK